jgi:hypothetical protein
MSPTGIDLALKIAQFAFQVLVLLVIPIALVLVRQILSLRRRTENLEGKTLTLADKIASLPDDNDLHSLTLTISNLNGEILRLGEVTTSLRNVVDRHEDYLWNGAKK